MRQLPNKPNDKTRFLSPIKLSFGFLSIVLLINGATLLALLWNTDFVSIPERILAISYIHPVYFAILAMFVVTLGAWILVVYRFKRFYQNLLDKDKERKIAEELLKKSEATVRELLENANDLIYTSDLQGNFTSLNKAGETLTGFTAEEACKMSISEVIAPEYLDLVRAMILEKLENQTTTRYEIEIITKSKDRVLIELSSRLIFEDRVPVGVQGIARDVTKRKKNEDDLRESEVKYRSLVDSIPAIVYIVEPVAPFTPVYVSANIQTLGYSIEDWAVPGFWDSIIHPDDIAEFETQNDAALGILAEKEVEYRIFAGDGSVRWILDRGRFVLDKTESPLYWQGVMLDITETKNAVEVVRESEQIYRFLSEGIVHQIWTAGPNGKLDYVSERTASYFGCDSSDLVNDGWEAFVHPEDMDDCLSKWMHSLNTGDYYEVRFRLKQANGQYLWHVGRATPGLDSDGKINKWFGTNTNVDEQVRSDAALRESEVRYRTLLENMGEGLLQVDNDSRIEFVNDRFCQMTGYSTLELLGHEVAEVLYSDGDRKILNARDERSRDGITEHYEIGLKKKSGEQLWVLVGGAPTFDQDGKISGSMGVFTDISERKLAEERLMHDAFHDSLTGLANRALFTDHLRLRIERAKREKNSVFGVLFLDFDRFKVINDSLGHAEGDKLLIAVAQRLESTLRSSDLIARLGGDEFTMLLNDLDDATHASKTAARIQELLSVPFSLESGEVFMSASIGIALGEDGSVSAEDMLRNADIAMYRAKSKGKARHQVFDQAMHDEALKQLQVETDLRQALERNEFCMHYQPIFNLSSREIVGFEALVRWKHPTRGMIPPIEFIPIAEENGLIIPLGRWILYESCRQMRHWLDNYPMANQLTMSVNLSVKQFTQSDLAEQVMANLLATRLDPKYLKLEITESHVMENGEAAVSMMKRLRALGAELSLDDFGTGYSSLSYLHRLPVSNLKIDRSFVNQMVAGNENSKLVSTIVSLAHNLNISVTAEGIETADQLQQLRELNCEMGQGYFFSKPLEADAATEIINSIIPKTRPKISGDERNLELIG